MVRASVMAVIVALLLSLVGCGDRAPSPESSPSDEKITLTLWHIMNYEGPREVIETAVRAFESAHPGVRVNVQTFDNDPYKTKLSVEMAGGAPPDIFFTWGGGGLASLAQAGRVLDLTDAMERDGWKDRFLPQPLAFCSDKGRIWAAPLDLSCVPVWYNAGLFARHNLRPPESFDELLALCRALRAKDVTPIALGNNAQWPGAFHFVYLATRIGGTELFFDVAARREGRRFNDPAFIRAGEMLQQMIEAGAFPTGFNGIDDSHARTRFLNGDAAMYVMGTWLVARAQEESPAMLPAMKCFTFPRVAEGRGEPGAMVGGVNCAFAVSSSCKHPEKAVALLRFLTAADVGEQWCRIGRIPALRVSEDALGRLPAPTREAMALLAAAPVIQPYYDQHLPPRLAEEHKKTTQGLFARTLTPAQAAERMEQCARGEQSPAQ